MLVFIIKSICDNLVFSYVVLTTRDGPILKKSLIPVPEILPLVINSGFF